MLDIQKCNFTACILLGYLVLLSRPAFAVQEETPWKALPSSPLSSHSQIASTSSWTYGMTCLGEVRTVNLVNQMLVVKDHAANLGSTGFRSFLLTHDTLVLKNNEVLPVSDIQTGQQVKILYKPYRLHLDGAAIHADIIL